MKFCRQILLASLCLLSSSVALGQGAPFVPNDPLFAQQWHLAKQSTGASIDANVTGAWAQGWTGQGVRIGIVESGSFQSDHPDLAANWVPEFDLSPWGAASHETNVAGVAAGRGGNGVGGTGAAPLASLSSLHVDYDPATTSDASQAVAARYRNDALDIKNWSVGWGADRFQWASYPHTRQGIADSEAAGTINVRAAMNANRDANAYSDKNFFGQIVVGATGSNGLRADYSNFGSNLTVTAPTLGVSGTLGITTTELGAGYTYDFSGTSSAAPLVSGVLALAKEAQPNLDTRMAKHLLARTSRVVDPSNPRKMSFPEYEQRVANFDDVVPLGQWRTNAAGINFSNDYGFGLIDATALVEAAQEFSGVTPLITASTGSVIVGEIIPEDNSLSKTFTLSQLGKVEDIQFDFSLTGLFKSSIQMTLTSPAGTTGLLHSAFISPAGTGNPGSRIWSMVTNAFWGEEAEGEWSVTMTDLPWNQPNEPADQVLWDSFGIVARIGDLVAAGPGDFDADGDVDGTDFLVWQRDYGQTARLRADDNNDGIVDAADYTIWRDNYGQGGTQALAAVPEPGSAGLVAIGVASVLGLHRRRRASFSVAA